MDEDAVKYLQQISKNHPTELFRITGRELSDLTQFWLDHHEVGGQDVWEQKQVEKVEVSNG
jgi:hypothetical protein